MSARILEHQVELREITQNLKKRGHPPAGQGAFGKKPDTFLGQPRWTGRPDTRRLTAWECGLLSAARGLRGQGPTVPVAGGPARLLPVLVLLARASSTFVTEHAGTGRTTGQCFCQSVSAHGRDPDSAHLPAGGRGWWEVTCSAPGPGLCLSSGVPVISGGLGDPLTNAAGPFPRAWQPLAQHPKSSLQRRTLVTSQMPLWECGPSGGGPWGRGRGRERRRGGSS